MKMQYQPECSVSHDGVEYVADANGVIDVPEAAYLALLSHGLVPYEEKKSKRDKE